MIDMFQIDGNAEITAPKSHTVSSSVTSYIKIKCRQRTNTKQQKRFTCGLLDHLGHHHLTQVQLPLSCTPAGGTPSIPFDPQHYDKKNCHEQNQTAQKAIRQTSA